MSIELCKQLVAKGVTTVELFVRAGKKKYTLSAPLEKFIKNGDYLHDPNYEEQYVLHESYFQKKEES